MKLEQIGNNFNLFSDLENDPMVIMTKSKYLSFKKQIEELESKVDKLQEQNDMLIQTNQAMCKSVEAATETTNALAHQFTFAWTKGFTDGKYGLVSNEDYIKFLTGIVAKKQFGTLTSEDIKNYLPAPNIVVVDEHYE